MLCPYCQNDVDSFAPATDGGMGLRCAACGEDGVPLLYTRDYDRHPAVPVSIFGPTGHGKTVYIEALLTHLERRITWPEFSCQWMDQNALLIARQRMQLLREHGQLPDATPSVFPRPQVVRLRSIPGVGGCQLIFYDTGGETFRDVDLLRDSGRYVKNSAAVLWLVSLADLEYPEQLSDLMTTYAQAMVSMGADPAKQSIVVALTKGDLLLDRPGLPAEARDFLLNDDLDPAGDAWDRLERLSDALERWLQNTGQRNVVNLLRGQFRSVRWCFVSAQGTSARDQMLEVAIMPRGVLGPLFWLWRESRPPVWLDAAGQRRLFFQLEDAIAAAPTDSVLTLEAGRYRLERSLKVQRPLQIHGPGAERCTLESTAPDFALGLACKLGSVHLRGVTIRHDGNAPADIVRVLHGRVELAGCILRGGVPQTPKIQGDGLRVASEGAVRLTDCILEANRGNGLSTTGVAEVHATACKFRANDGHGLHVAGKSITLQQCEASDHRTSNGIHITESARAEVVDCIFSRNKNGIAAFRSAQIELKRNLCERNGLDGIVVKDSVAVNAEGNRCVKNRQAGISLHDMVRGEVFDNRCKENATAGIELEEQASVHIIGNTCEQNRGSGIEYRDQSGGGCDRNIASANEGHGFDIGGQAKPSLDKNESKNNGGAGIRVAESAAPTIGQENVVQGNSRGDFQPPRLGRRGWFG